MKKQVPITYHRGAAARTYDDLWKAVGSICCLFTAEERYNFFKAAGYGAD